MNRKIKRKKAVIVTLISLLVIVFVFIALYNGLVVKEYHLETDKINSSIRIVVIADLHSTIYGNNQQDLIHKIKEQSPDVILLAGDIADDHEPIKGTQLLLEGIRDTVPIYYVTGNHEHWSKQVDAIKEEISHYGVRILSDEYEEIEINNNKIIIAGIEDPSKANYKEDSMDRAFSILEDDETYKILLAHRPELIELYKKYNFDLVVSGHAHGGQIRIPFVLNGLYAPNQGWFPKYGGGLYEHDDLVHIISRGLSFNWKLPRVFNPPEIVVIDLVSQRNESNVLF